MDGSVSRVALGAARTAGRTTAWAGRPITDCPYPSGPRRFAFVDAYLQVRPPQAGAVSYDDVREV